jgi:hypothetical protein
MLIDKSGILKYVHYGKSMADIPDISEIEKAFLSFLNDIFFCQHINQCFGGGCFLGDDYIRAQLMQLFCCQTVAAANQKRAPGIFRAD